MASRSPHRIGRSLILHAAISAALAGGPGVYGQTPPAPAPAAPAPAVGAAPAAQGPRVLEGLPILRVETVGNTRTETRLILDQTRAQAGQLYSRALVDVDVKAVASLDRFITVQAEVVPVENEQTRQIRGVIVRFVVEERPLVTAVEIVGNRKFNDTDLREGLLVRAGVAVDPFRIESDRKFILDKYRSKGYADVAVEVDQTLVKTKGIVRYTVIEGASAKISKVDIVGNLALTDAYIKWRIQTKTYFWIFRKGLLDMDKLQGDVVTIREMFTKRGYLDARVSYTLDYTEDKQKLTVRFTVIEGTRYTIGKINLNGNKTFAPFELLTGTDKFGPGKAAESDKRDALRRRMEDVYGHQGYINSSIDMKWVYTDTPGVVDLDINIVEGLPYTVGRVIVRGNGNIQDRVVRRQVRIYPDQTYDTVLVKKSIDRLKATRIISDVKITPIDAPGNPAGVKDALVEVQEGQTGRFLVGAGVSTNSGLVGQISIEQQNYDISNSPKSWSELYMGQAWKGAGQFSRILLEPGTEFQRYRLTFEEPYLLDTPYSFGNDLFYFTRGRESWDERRIGDIVTFGRRFGDVWGVSLAFRAEQVTISNPQDFGTQGETDNPSVQSGGKVYQDSPQEVLNEYYKYRVDPVTGKRVADGIDNDHFVTSIKPGIVRDTTDSRIFPTTGTRTSFSIEQYGAMGGDVDITKFVFNFDWYTPVYEDVFDRKTVLSIRNQFGIIPFGDSPFYERFYAGGIGDLRGFKFRGVSPRGPLSQNPRKDPIGGDFEWVTTVELNYPIWENILRGVVFVDVGTVESDITVSNIRSDFGLGVRISLPFFNGLPLAVDFAYPTTKADGDRTQIISVSLGASF